MAKVNSARAAAVEGGSRGCAEIAADTSQEGSLPIRGPHIGVLAERRYMTQAQPAGLCSQLRARGHPVTVIDPEAASFEIQDADWLDGLGLVVARGRSSALLAMLAWAEAQGVATINRRSAIAAVHNKAEMAAALAAADVPTPRTFLGPPRELANRVPSASYPLVLKPILGDNCRGLRFIRTPGELSAIELRDPVVLAQEFLPNDGYDLKLYGIGDQIWAVRKASPFNPPVPTRLRAGSMDHRVTAQLLPLFPAIEELGHCCRDLFCLELYGVDCIETSRGPVVIEVNEFPNYTGVPDADERLADYLLRRAPRAVHPSPIQRRANA
jgi:ribosomal protein S6--L-glutamate ligase